MSEDGNLQNDTPKKIDKPIDLVCIILTDYVSDFYTNSSCFVGIETILAKTSFLLR